MTCDDVDDFQLLQQRTVSPEAFETGARVAIFCSDSVHPDAFVRQGTVRVGWKVAQTMSLDKVALSVDELK